MTDTIQPAKQEKGNVTLHVKGGDVANVLARSGFPYCIHGRNVEEEGFAGCPDCMNSSLGGRKEGEPMPTIAELEEILRGDENAQANQTTNAPSV